MEIIQNETKKLNFHGDGTKLFGITIVNLLLTIFTLGFYYPWAKATKLKYMYQETEFEGSRFSFLGTGKEIFSGFIKAVIIFIILYLMLLIPTIMHLSTMTIAIGFAVFYVGVIFLIPVAIHGSLKYRLSRTTWRSIHFGYRGNRTQLIKLYVGGFLLTIVTFGLYGAWFSVKLRQYVISNVRFGNVKFDFKGKGSDYFLLNLKGFLLTLVTLGIYYFWFVKDLFNFYIDNIKLEQGETQIEITSDASGSEFFKLLFVNLLLILVTLGLATPWTVIRTMRFITSRIHVGSNLDVDSIAQTEDNYTNATGDDMADFLDINLI